MPPWKPVPGAGDFDGSRRMTAQEIATIERWVRRHGRQAGADARPRPVNADHGWEPGSPI